jgi:hypothetical protein
MISLNFAARLQIRDAAPPQIGAPLYAEAEKTDAQP